MSRRHAEAALVLGLWIGSVLFLVVGWGGQGGGGGGASIDTVDANYKGLGTSTTAGVSTKSAAADHQHAGPSANVDGAGGGTFTTYRVNTGKNSTLTQSLAAGTYQLTLDAWTAIYTPTAVSAAIANTVTETIFSTNYTYTANKLIAGRHVRVTGWGPYSTTLTPTGQIKLKCGTTILGDSGAITLANGAASKYWGAIGDFVVYTTGATGTAVGHISVFLDTGGAFTNSISARTAGTVTLDTTASNATGFSWTWSAASASNTVTADCVIVEQTL